MGKKKADEMNKQREKFLDGSAKKGVEHSIADALFDKMVLFAEYCLSYDTNVMTVEYGTLPIGKIVTEKIACTVWSVNELGYVIQQPIVQWHNRGEQEVFEYLLENGNTIRSTADHKFMTIDRQMLSIQEIFDRGLDLFQLDELP